MSGYAFHNFHSTDIEFYSYEAAVEATQWWSDNVGRPGLRARAERLGSTHASGKKTPLWLVLIEVHENGAWLIAEYLPRDRELWGQIPLPLEAA